VLTRRFEGSCTELTEKIAAPVVAPVITESTCRFATSFAVALIVMTVRSATAVIADATPRIPHMFFGIHFSKISRSHSSFLAKKKNRPVRFGCQRIVCVEYLPLGAARNFRTGCRAMNYAAERRSPIRQWARAGGRRYGRAAIIDYGSLFNF